MTVGNHAVMIAVATIFLLPVVFIVLTALMTDQQVFSANLWPSPFRWSNFTEVFHKIPLFAYTRNTFVIASLSTIGVVVSCIPVAYALSRMRWRGREATFLVVLATMMLPFQVTVIPLYILFVRFGWIGTMKPLIVPLFFGDAFTIFLLRQFLLTIPKEYVDAAKVDGCGDFKALIRVVLPMAKPAIAATALFQFFFCWNDYFGPQIYASENPGAWTLSYGLETFKSAHHTNWNLTMAATLLVMAPVIIVFFFAQKAFIEGVTLTGVKG